MKKNNGFCLRHDDEVLLRRYLYSRSEAEMSRLEMQLPDEEYIHQVLRDLVDTEDSKYTKTECRSYVDGVLTEMDKAFHYFFTHGSPVQVESLFFEFNKNSVSYTCCMDSDLIYRYVNDRSAIVNNLTQVSL